jgi:1-deoxy-D-xylulose-5-phosphate synthase
MSLLAQIDSPADLKRLQPEQLAALCAELRELILRTISERGGHLGAALGVVELAVALHYVFESPTDKIVWDIGHQAHAHKILTGRRAAFHTIKQAGGLSGFLRRSESPHDVFGAGHANTSISAALGIREALRLKEDPGKVVAVIGDAGMTGGMAFEALNNAGALRRDLIVVLNDNAMGISPTVGALSEWLSRKLTGGAMTRWRRRVRTVLDAFDNVGQDAIRFIERAMETTKVMLTPGILFEGLGFEYVGPIDGHDLEVLVDTLRDVRGVGQPILVHVVTRKGKGYPPAEEEAQRFHGVGPFDLRTGLDLGQQPQPPTYTQVFGQTVAELAARDPRVVAITAAMLEGTGLQAMASRFPGRVYDVGIAEQHAVTFAAGLACEGFRPIVAIYSSFLQRAFDQVLHDVCLQELPVILCLDRAGLVGEDGPTHHGLYDPAYLRIIPGLTLMAPRDEAELRHMLATALEASCPVAIRYPRGAGVGLPLVGAPAPLPWGKAEVLLAAGDEFGPPAAASATRGPDSAQFGPPAAASATRGPNSAQFGLSAAASTRGPELLLLAAGPVVYAALAAARALAAGGVRTTVVNARFLKPLDEETLCPLLERAAAVITIEESCLAGGFGSSILELCERHDLRPRLRRLGAPDRWVAHDAVAAQRRGCALDADGIVAAARSLLGQSDRLPQSVASAAARH